MSKTTYIVNALLLLFIIVLSVITYQSEDTVIQEAEEAAEQAFFNKNIPEENFQGEYFSFYLPENMEAEEVDGNNAILHHGNQTMLVFYNSLEKDNSELNYNAAKTDKATLLKTFLDDSRFGYIRILPDDKEEETYELQVGVGGVKVTTYTKKSEIVLDTEKLMNIAVSIVE